MSIQTFSYYLRTFESIEIGFACFDLCRGQLRDVTGQNVTSVRGAADVVHRECVIVVVVVGLALAQAGPVMDNHINLFKMTVFAGRICTSVGLSVGATWKLRRVSSVITAPGMPCTFDICMRNSTIANVRNLFI